MGILELNPWGSHSTGLREENRGEFENREIDIMSPIYNQREAASGTAARSTSAMASVTQTLRQMPHP